MTKLTLLSRAVAQVTAALGACLLACACPAAAFTPSSKSGSENTPLDLNPSSSAAHTTGTGGASLVRTIVGLAIVIAVIWGLAWILRQVKAGREGGGDSHHSSTGLATVAALGLGSGRSVHLVRAGSDYVLLGSTEHGVAPIHRYTEEQAREAGLLFADAAPERSRLASAASQIVAGTGRALGQGRLLGQGEQSAEGELTSADGYSGYRGGSSPNPVVGRRPDPMRMPSPSSGVIERLREWTVRR
jgi:flagellar protein FliO/FliZ